MTRAEEHAAKVRSLLNEGVGAIESEFVCSQEEGDRLSAEHQEASAALSELVADAEALAEALEPFLRGTGPDRAPRPPTWETAGQHVVWLNKGEWEVARNALARYRGEKP